MELMKERGMQRRQGRVDSDGGYLTPPPEEPGTGWTWRGGTSSFDEEAAKQFPAKIKA